MTQSVQKPAITSFRRPCAVQPPEAKEILQFVTTLTYVNVTCTKITALENHVY